MKKIILSVIAIATLYSKPLQSLEATVNTLYALGPLIYNTFNKADTSLPSFESFDLVSIVPISDPVKNIRNSSANEIKATLYKNKLDDILVINGQQYHVTNGISDTLGKNVTLYLGGFMNDCRPYPWYVARQIYKGLKGGSYVVARCHPTDDRTRFNPGGEQDIYFIKATLDEIHKKNQDTDILIHAACIGWSRFLPFWSRCANDPAYHHYTKHIKAIIVESPPLSINKAIDGVFGFIAPFAQSITRCWYPHLNGNAPTLGKNLPDTPLFIASVPHDTLSNLQDLLEEIKMWEEKRGRNANSIDHFISKNATLVHGRVTKDPEFWKRAIAFKSKVLRNIDV